MTQDLDLLAGIPREIPGAPEPKGQALDYLSALSQTELAPAKEGHLFDVSKKTGLPVESLRRAQAGQLSVIDHGFERSQIMDQNARLAEWLAKDPSHAGISHDDLVNLSRLQESSKRLREITEYDYGPFSFGDRLAATGRGVAVLAPIGFLGQTGKQIAGLGRFLTEIYRVGAEAVGAYELAEQFERNSKMLGRFGRASGDIKRRLFANEADFQRYQAARFSVFGIGLDDLEEGGLSMIPAILSGPSGFYIAAGLQTGAPTFTDKMDESEQFLRATAWAAYTGSVTALLTKLIPGGERNLAKMATMSPEASRRILAAGIAKTVAAGAAGEFAEEFLDQLNQEMITEGKILTNPREALRNSLKAGAIGGILGGGTGGVEVLYARRMAPAVRAAIVDQAMQIAMEQADGTQTMQRSSEAGIEFLQDEGVPERMYLDPSAVQELLIEDPGREQALRSLDIDVDNLRTLVNDGQAIPIDTARLFPMKDKALREQLRMNLRETENALSAREAQEFNPKEEAQKANDTMRELSRDYDALKTESSRLVNELADAQNISTDDAANVIRLARAQAVKHWKDGLGAVPLPSEQLAQISFEGVQVEEEAEGAFLEQAERPSVINALAEREVTGDQAENAADLAETIIGKGGQVTEQAEAILYHRTTPEAARQIIEQQEMTGREDGIFLGTRPSGQISGYGEAVVRVTVPLESIQLDDEFDNEAHVRIPLLSPGETISVSATEYAPTPAVPIVEYEQIQPPYREGSQKYRDWYDALTPRAQETLDFFEDILRIGDDQTITVMRVKKKGQKPRPVQKDAWRSFITAQEWNENISQNPDLARAARRVWERLTPDQRTAMRLSKSGRIKLTDFDKEFKVSTSFMQRVIDSMPNEEVPDFVILPDGTRIDQMGSNGRLIANGGEAYRRSLVQEKREHFIAGTLRQVSIKSLDRDNWGAMGFIASNSKTFGSGDFTTMCPQLYYNKGCFYCYRRAALETGINVKLAAQKVWYAGELLALSDADVETLNQNGGLRIQSFGDWMGMRDHAQFTDMIIDAEARGLQVKIITKEIAMVDFVAHLKAQGIANNVFMNLSTDYIVEEAGELGGSQFYDPANPDRPFFRVEGRPVWKRALSVDEADVYRQKYNWLNIRTVALTQDQFIESLRDDRVDVVTGYHGNIRQPDAYIAEAESGTTVTEVEPLGDSGMPGFDDTGNLTGKTAQGAKLSKVHQRLYERIVSEGLEREYAEKSCCVTGKCATCKVKCGAPVQSKKALRGQIRFPVRDQFLNAVPEPTAPSFEQEQMATELRRQNGIEEIDERQMGTTFEQRHEYFAGNEQPEAGFLQDIAPYETDIPVRMMSLFSGGGTVELGLSGLVAPGGAVEINSAIADVYRTAHESDVEVADVRDVDFSKYAEAQYLHASPVCKNYSRAKAVQGEVAVDIVTAEATARAIRTIKPKVFTLENVSGYQQSEALGIIKAELEAQGYSYDEDVYDAADYGAYTHRRRYLLRASRDGVLPAKPMPTHAETPNMFQAPYNSWFSAIEDIIDELPDGELAAWQLPRLKKQGVQFDLPTIVMGGSAGKNILVADSTQPAPTIKATPKELHRVVMPDGRVKKLTPRALARIQGMPDSYPLPSNAQIAQTIVGNGVPTQLTRAVFGPLMEQVSYSEPAIPYRPTELMQEAGARRRGAVRIIGDRYIVKILKGADLSTAIHELSHVFLHKRLMLIQEGNLNEELLSDWNTSGDWLVNPETGDIAQYVRGNKVESREQVEKTLRWLEENGEQGLREAARDIGLSVEDPDVSLVLGRAFNEKWAEAFEKYAMEGKAPSLELRGPFRRFRQWLTNVYRRIRVSGVELNEDITHVFDRMLATDREIEEVRLANNLAPWTAEEMESLEGLGPVSRKRHNDMMLAIREDMAKTEWERRTKELAKRRNEWSREIEEEMMAEATYIAWDVIREAGGLDVEQTRIEFGKELVADLRSKGLMAKVAEQGADINTVAQQAGFSDSEDMIISLLAARKPREELRSRLADREIDEDASVPPVEALIDSPNVVNAAYERRKFISQAQRTGIPQLTRDIIKDRATESLGKMSLTQASRVSSFMNQSLKHYQLERNAWAKQDWRRALDENYKHLLNHEMAKQAREIREFRSSEEKYAKRVVAMLPAKGKKVSVEPSYLHYATKLIRDFQMVDADVIPKMPQPTRLVTGEDGRQYTKPVESLRQLLQDEEDIFEGAHDDSANYDEWLIVGPAAEQQWSEIVDRAGKDGVKLYNGLTVEQFDQLSSMVRRLVRRGRAILDDRFAKLNVRFEQARDEMLDAMDTIKDKTRVFEDQIFFKQWVQKFKDSLSEDFGKADFFWRMADGGNGVRFADFDPNMPHAKYLMLPSSEAERAHDILAGEVDEAIRPHWEKIAAGVKRLGRDIDTRVPVPQVMIEAGIRKWTGKHVFGMALYRGTDYSLKNMARGFGWVNADGDPDITNVLELTSLLNADEWRAVQGIWNVFEDVLWGRSALTYSKMFLQEPPKAPRLKSEVMSADKQLVKLDGGYFPIRFDGRMSVRQARIEEQADMKEMFGAQFGNASARRGHLMARTNTGGKPFLLNPQTVLSQQLEFAIRFITHGEFVRDANKIITDPVWSAQFKRKFGPAFYGTLNGWLRSQVSRESQRLSWLGRMINRLRKSAGLAILGGRLKSGINQTDAFFQLLADLGWNNLLEGSARIMENPKREWDNMMQEPFMRDRLKGSRMRELNELFSDIDTRALAKGSKLVLDKTQQALMWPIVYPALAIEFPHWVGQYHKWLGLTNGDVDRARLLASEAIASTQPTTRPKDLSQIERQRGVISMVTFMKTAFNRFMSTDAFLVRSMMEKKMTFYEGMQYAFLRGVLAPATPHMLTFLLWSGLSGLTDPDEEDKERWNRFFRDVGSDILYSRIGGWYFGGEVTELVGDAVAAFTFDPERKVAVRVPKTFGAQFFDMHVKSVGGFVDILKALGGDDERDFRAGAWTIAELMSWYLGVPAVRIIEDFDEGLRQQRELGQGPVHVLIPEPALRRQGTRRRVRSR